MADEKDPAKSEPRPLTLGDIFSQEALQTIGATLGEAILSIDYQAIIRQLLVNANKNYSMKGLTAKEQRQLMKLLEKMLSGKATPGPGPLTDEKKIELVEAFKASGLTQEIFLSRDLFELQVSRSTLQRALKWYKANRKNF